MRQMDTLVNGPTEPELVTVTISIVCYHGDMADKAKGEWMLPDPAIAGRYLCRTCRAVVNVTTEKKGRKLST
jgi:hypothetical protein